VRYFDALASGRLKRIEGLWAFYPWGGNRGYIIPTREEYWEIHAWAARASRTWGIAAVAAWLIAGPLLAMPLLAAFLLWFRRVAVRRCAGFEATSQPLTMSEIYGAQAEVHSWWSLWFLTFVCLTITVMAAAGAVLVPPERMSLAMLAVWFGALLTGSIFMLWSKWRG